MAVLNSSSLLKKASILFIGVPGGISHPDEQKLYYVKIYGKRGSGNYRLTARSYTGKDMMIAGIKPSEYAGYIASVTDVKAPDDLNVTIPVPPTAYTIKAAEL